MTTDPGMADATRSRRKALDAEMCRQAFRSLVTVLDPDPFPVHGGEETALREALVAIARELGEAPRETVPDATTAPFDTALRQWCRKAGWIHRRISLPDRWWRQDPAVPMLAFFDGAPVAVVSRGLRLRFREPGSGRLHLVSAAVAARFEETAYAFYRPLPRNRELRLRDLLAEGVRSGFSFHVAMILILGCLGAAIGLLTPVVTGLLVDEVFPEGDRRALFQVAAVLLIVPLVAGLLHLVRSAVYLRMSGRIEASLQPAILDRILFAPYGFHQTQASGDLADRAHGVSQILRTATTLIVDSLLISVFSTLNLGLMLACSLKLTVIAVAVSVLPVVVHLALLPGILARMRRYRDDHGRIQAFVVQILNAISKIRVCGAESRAWAQWAERFSILMRTSFEAGRLAVRLDVAATLLGLLGLAVVFGAVPGEDEISVGIFVTFFAAFSVFQGTLSRLLASLVEAVESLPAVERLRPVLAVRPENSGSGLSPGQLEGRIELDRVSCRYGDGPRVLDGVSFTVAPGEFVAIVGPSGSGKTTILRVLLGFVQPESGSVLWDGHDLRSLDPCALRARIGSVLQEGRLLPDTVFANIAGAAGLTLDEAWEAARLAGIDQDIAQMPMGMHTVLNEGATTLSGGQRQRILLARALALKPSVLLLDEATSALDNPTQARVAAHIAGLGMTRVVIAHRLSTIRNADRILVLDRGRIVETGRFEDLMASRGLFHSLAERQEIPG